MSVDPEIQARLDWLERAVIVLADSVPGVTVRLPPRPNGIATGPAGIPGADQEVRALVEAGKTVRAVKVYQDVHGVGLKEAKRAVDQLAERLGRR